MHADYADYLCRTLSCSGEAFQRGGLVACSEAPPNPHLRFASVFTSTTQARKPPSLLYVLSCTLAGGCQRCNAMQRFLSLHLRSRLQAS